MKEERYELRYISKKDGTVKNCYPRSSAKKDEQLQICKENGVKVIHCRKLYPFNTEANQHNFMLISNKCRNIMSDMESGEIPWDEAEYDRLSATKEKADELFELPLPLAWIPWETWKDAKEISTQAIVLRQEACVASGHPEWVSYC